MASSLTQNSAAKVSFGCINAPQPSVTTTKQFCPLDLSQSASVYRLCAAAAAAATVGGDSSAAAALFALSSHRHDNALTPITASSCSVTGSSEKSTKSCASMLMPPQPPSSDATLNLPYLSINALDASLSQRERQSAFTLCQPLGTVGHEVTSVSHFSSNNSLPQNIITTTQQNTCSPRVTTATTFMTQMAQDEVCVTNGASFSRVNNILTASSKMSLTSASVIAVNNTDATVLNLSVAPPPLPLTSMITAAGVSAPSTSTASTPTSSSGREATPSAGSVSPSSTIKKMTRKEFVRDAAYWERRRKNNDAAKRSRDSRRKKEDEVTIRAALLEQENLRLRYEIDHLKSEVERYRILALADYRNIGNSQSNNNFVVVKNDQNNNDANNNNDNNFNDNNNNFNGSKNLNSTTLSQNRMSKIVVVDINGIMPPPPPQQQQTKNIYCENNNNTICVNNKNNIDCNTMQVDRHAIP